MRHRERVLKALNHEVPDRVPIHLGALHSTSIHEEAYKKLLDHMGIRAREDIHLINPWSGYVVPHEELLQSFDVDMRVVRPDPTGTLPFGVEVLPDGSFKDEWGVIRKKPKAGFFIIANTPIEGDPDVSSIKGYRWPDPDAPGRNEGLPEAVREWREEGEYALILELPGQVNILGRKLRGFETWHRDIILNPEFAGALLDAGMEVEMRMIERMLGAVGGDVDIVYIMEGLSMHEGPLMSPDLYRRLIKPRQKRLFQFIKGLTDARLALHCCGAVYPFIRDFVEIGVDILNPIQVTAHGMDPRKIKKEFGRDITLWGGIDNHYVIPDGTPDEVSLEVKRRIEEMAAGGGYILSTDHSFLSHVRPENICSVFKAAMRFGKYNGAG